MPTFTEARSLHSRRATAIICEQLARIGDECFGACLRSVVLTGSLAREEGTFIEENHSVRLLGDADCFLLFHEGEPLPTRSALDTTERKLSGALRDCGVIAKAGLEPVYIAYLKNLPRHIATYELLTSGRIVWGDREVLSSIPVFERSQISREDAWRMLGNRMIELLEAVAEAPETGAPSLESRYRTVKLYLDMATSYLVFAGSYTPTYREREQTLQRLADNQSAQHEAPFPLWAFANRVTACTRLKLEGPDAMEFSQEMFGDAILFARRLWKWELMRLTGETGDTSESRLMLLWMRSQPIRARIRGWASVLRRSGGLRTWQQWPRWIRLGWRASPRYWVYSVAAGVFFGMPQAFRQEPNAETELQHLARGLLSSNSGAGAMEWRSIASIVAADYRRFLTTTHT